MQTNAPEQTKEMDAPTLTILGCPQFLQYLQTIEKENKRETPWCCRGLKQSSAVELPKTP